MTTLNINSDSVQQCHCKSGSYLRAGADPTLGPCNACPEYVTCDFGSEFDAAMVGPPAIVPQQASGYWVDTKDSTYSVFRC